jgi:uncharacterized protein (TIGR02996 family)
VTYRAALLAAVLDAPWDDTPRFVCADWLRERDDPADHARGRFLAAGVAAARFRDQDPIDDPDFYRVLEDLSGVASAGDPAGWVTASASVGPRLFLGTGRGIASETGGPSGPGLRSRFSSGGCWPGYG